MALICKICTHPDRTAFDLELINHSTLQKIASKVPCSTSAVHRHKTKHLAADLAKSRQATDMARADTLLGRVEGLLRDCKAIASEATAAKNWQAATAALKEVRGCLELLGRISGEIAKTEGSAVQLIVTYVDTPKKAEHTPYQQEVTTMQTIEAIGVEREQ